MIKVVEPSAEILILKGVEALRAIEAAGRISHASEDAQTEDSYLRFIQAVVIDHGDWSIVEHVSASVLFTVDRGVSHELVRHRLASYTQSSTRFINYAKKMPPEFIVPPGLDLDTYQGWCAVVAVAEQAYRDMIATGYAPQIARSVLPNALATKIIMTCNLRNWRHFLLMRTTRETHPQMRQVTIPLLRDFQTRVPLLFADIEPDCRQVENLKKAR